MSQDIKTTPLPLADIHLVDAPTYWPFAWGWWLVFVVAVVLIIIAILGFRKNTKNRAAQRQALQQLDGLNSSNGLTAVNELLRKAALSYFPRDHVAKLSGQNWLAFLDATQGNSSAFTDLSETWRKGLFSSESLSEEEFRQCHDVARKWLKHALPPAKSNQGVYREKVAGGQNV